MKVADFKSGVCTMSRGLDNAKLNKNDEFYTRLEDIKNK